MTQWVDLEVEKEKRFSMYHRQFFAQILCLCYENPCKDRILFTVFFPPQKEHKIEQIVEEVRKKILHLQFSTGNKEANGLIIPYIELDLS